jgi:putative zinc finger/helix-turn-helix YgiT family protein
MIPEILKCPRGHSDLSAINVVKEKTFRGQHIAYEIETYICDKCGIAVGTVDQAANAQLAMAEAYRQKVGLLTSAEIKENRAKLGWSQQKLAKMTSLGISSIKRWELGIIQTAPMDRLLRDAFKGNKMGDPYTGNRELSLERIKLVMKEFEKNLGVPLLEDGDMMLYDAKFTWFADMVAYRELGRSMTGAAYAALPYGPQLNNYLDLVDLIRKADETKAEPLSEYEKKIIARVARKFPTKQMVYDASHREPVWKDKTRGSIIPYSDSQLLREI